MYKANAVPNSVHQSQVITGCAPKMTAAKAERRAENLLKDLWGGGEKEDKK